MSFMLALGALMFGGMIAMLYYRQNQILYLPKATAPYLTPATNPPGTILCVACVCEKERERSRVKTDRQADIQICTHPVYVVSHPSVL
jgi:hypothetical protein